MDAERARALLAAERERLTGVKAAADRLTEQAVEAASRELSRAPMHPGDMGSEVEEREKDLAVRSAVEAQLADIDAADRRVVDGTYGRCERCGQPIPEERLEAIPTARYCVEDQARVERSEG